MNVGHAPDVQRPSAAPSSDGSAGPFTGTGQLFRLAARRDRVRLPVWLIGLTAVIGASTNALVGFYDTPVKQAGYAATVENSAVSRLMGGTPYDVDTFGGILAYEITAVAGVTVALMVIFLVTRHIRGEEESGNAELVRSAVTGRHAALAATLALASVASGLAGLLVAGVLALSGVAVGPSLLFGAGLAAIGLAFTAVAAVAAQVASTARTALGGAILVMLALFIVRGIGAVEDNWLTWLAPFGWQDEIRPFGERAQGWPLLVSIGFAAVVLALAAWLAARRDFGAGLLQARAGRPTAAGWLRTPMALAFRMQRGLLLAWGVGLVVLAAVFGAVGREVRTMIDSNPEVGQVILGQIDDVVLGYLSFVTHFMGVTVATYAVVSALRLRREEESGRADAVLAGGVSRTRWALSGIVVTAGCSALMAVAVGLGVGLTHGLVSDDMARVGPLLGAALGTLPAVWTLAAVAFALHGWVPRWTALVWLPTAWAFIQAYLGDLLDFPDGISGLSPFWHLPKVPAESFEPVAFVVLTGLALALTALGVAGLRRRDLA
ncbi:ABC transporter permease [Nocardioides gilvus]|uniref:ABC transporter permease n=1 Tax=Nocardioides gilvus TaxID=1735589 RepID=UPI000D74D428|nr:ABC transporter permease [Nocardioides gilvus]